MALRDRIAYLRKELREMLGFAEKIQSSLTFVSSKDFPERQRSLAALRELEHGLRSIEEHCHVDDRAVESTLHHFAGEAARRRMESEHAAIVRAVADFREELRFATADRTDGLRAPGLALLGQLRPHILYEENLLKAIEKKKPVKRQRQNRRSTIKTTARKHTTRLEKPIVPYTMEPHPEL